MADETTVDEVVVTAPAKRPPAGGTKVYDPQVSVILRKNVMRSEASEGISVSQRVRETGQEIDLTPYLGEGSAIQVSRSTRGGAGMFGITFPDQMVLGQMESLYGIIEPMDIIEIRAARDVSTLSGAGRSRLPILMRGFVGTVGRDTSITGRGPQRIVRVSGHDYGKILEIMRIAYLPGMVLGQDLLSSLKLFLNFGPEAKADQPAHEFVKEVVDKVVNAGFLAKMRAADTPGVQSPVQDLAVDAVASKGIVSPFGSQEWPGGTVRDLLNYFGDVGPWNELFVEDREEGPFVVYRPNPFKTADEVQIQDGPAAVVVDVYSQDLMQMSEERSDESVSNYFWVDAPRYSMIFSQVLRLEAQEGRMSPEPLLKDYRNASPDIYGIRMMMVESQQGSRLDGQSEGDMEAGNGQAVGDISEKRRVLIESNKDNVVLETGAIRLKGDERIRAGCYVRVRRGGGDLWGEYYAHSVMHHIVPFSGAFTTSINYDRGTGFIERLQRGRGTNSPYLAELNLKGAYGG